MAFAPAQRKRVFLKLALTGPSGSGKTFSALQLACGLASAGGQKIAVIDTENSSSELYAGLCDFDVCTITPPYWSQKYIDALQEAIDAKYGVVVIDSMSHQWAGSGGILNRKEQLDQRGGNSYANWATFTKEHEGFKAFINNAPVHVIATMRSKQDYALVTEDGRTTVKKLGLGPVQREGAEYEFTTVFDIAMNHEATVSKDRTNLFQGTVGLLTPRVGKALYEWLEGAAQPPTSSVVDTPADTSVRANGGDPPPEWTPQQQAQLTAIVKSEARKRGLSDSDLDQWAQKSEGVRELSSVSPHTLADLGRTLQVADSQKLADLIGVNVAAVTAAGG